MNLPNLYVIIPVLNEERNVPILMERLLALGKEVAGEFRLRLIVVDDGSADRTAARVHEFADRIPISILNHDENRGPGAAFGTAFEHLRGKLGDGDWVATMEGDNTSSASTLLRMLARRKEGYEAVLASPYSYGGGFTATKTHRVLLSHCANGLSKLLLNIRGIHTLSCFFRLYDADVLRRLYSAYGSRIVESRGFECMIELLRKLVNVGATISEVPFTVDTSQRKGWSRMKILKTVFGYFRVFVKCPRVKAERPNQSAGREP